MVPTPATTGAIPPARRTGSATMTTSARVVAATVTIAWGWAYPVALLIALNTRAVREYYRSGFVQVGGI